MQNITYQEEGKKVLSTALYVKYFQMWYICGGSILTEMNILTLFFVDNGKKQTSIYQFEKLLLDLTNTSSD